MESVAEPFENLINLINSLKNKRCLPAVSGVYTLPEALKFSGIHCLILGREGLLDLLHERAQSLKALTRGVGVGVGRETSPFAQEGKGKWHRNPQRLWHLNEKHTFV